MYLGNRRCCIINKTGLPGAEGPIGAYGEIGEKGLRGVQGKIGSQGDTGICYFGDRGQTGATGGMTGPQGYTGIIGAKSYSPSINSNFSIIVNPINLPSNSNSVYTDLISLTNLTTQNYPFVTLEGGTTYSINWDIYEGWPITIPSPNTFNKFYVSLYSINGNGNGNGINNNVPNVFTSTHPTILTNETNVQLFSLGNDSITIPTTGNYIIALWQSINNSNISQIPQSTTQIGIKFSITFVKVS